MKNTRNMTLKQNGPKKKKKKDFTRRADLSKYVITLKLNYIPKLHNNMHKLSALQAKLMFTFEEFLYKQMVQYHFTGLVPFLQVSELAKTSHQHGIYFHLMPFKITSYSQNTHI